MQRLLPLTCCILQRLDRYRQKRISRTPHETQANTLRHILRANAQSQFGRTYAFDTIRTPDEFQRLVPLQDYESLRPYIDAEIADGTTQLTVASPACYARTSGTTGMPKHIPVTPELLASLKKQQRNFLATAWHLEPGAFAGKTLSFMGSSREGVAANGRPLGAMTGLLFDTLPKALQRNTVTPPPVFDIADYDVRACAIAVLALTHSDITCLMSANPSSLLQLMTTLKSEAALIEACLETGNPGILGNDPSLTNLFGTLAPNHSRALEFRTLADQHRLSFSTLWPDIRLLATWTGGSCGIALERLTPLLPKSVRIIDLGYAASECRFTTLVAENGKIGFPVIDDVFFEFMAVNRTASGQRAPLLIDALEEGVEYDVIVTTRGGLYRYAMNDVVRVNGRYGQTPLLEFVRKSQGVTNITGEKLSENQVIDVMAKLIAEQGVSITFYIVVADSRASRYTAYIEGTTGVDECQAIARVIDTQLQNDNIEYASKRKSGRLGPIRVATLRDGTQDAYKRFAVCHGQRETQFKPALLLYRERLAFPIEQFERGTRNQAERTL